MRGATVFLKCVTTKGLTVLESSDQTLVCSASEVWPAQIYKHIYECIKKDGIVHPRNYWRLDKSIFGIVYHRNSPPPLVFKQALNCKTTGRIWTVIVTKWATVLTVSLVRPGHALPPFTDPRRQVSKFALLHPIVLDLSRNFWNKHRALILLFVYTSDNTESSNRFAVNNKTKSQLQYYRIGCRH